MERIRKLVSQWSNVFRYGGVAGLFLAVYLVMLRPVKKHMLTAFREFPGRRGKRKAHADELQDPESTRNPIPYRWRRGLENQRVFGFEEATGGKGEGGTGRRGQLVQSWIRETAGDETCSALKRGASKAAIFVGLMGEEAASKVFKSYPRGGTCRKCDGSHCGNGSDQPANGDADPGGISQAHTHPGVPGQGGSEYAKRLLVKAFGEDGASALMEQVARAQEISASKLDSLQKSDPLQLAKFLESEHPQTIALILAHLDPKQGARCSRGCRKRFERRP